MEIYDEFVIDGVISLPSYLTQEEFEVLFFNWLEDNTFQFGGSVVGFVDKENE
jgi:hypothetical protein